MLEKRYNGSTIPLRFSLHLFSGLAAPCESIAACLSCKVTGLVGELFRCPGGELTFLGTEALICFALEKEAVALWTDSERIMAHKAGLFGELREVLNQSLRDVSKLT